jgi:hypothetical protein
MRISKAFDLNIQSAASLVIIASVMCNTALAQDKPELRCPLMLSSKVNEEKYKGWTISSNNPLRLTGAWITRSDGGHLDETPDPDKTVRLNDRSDTLVRIHYLKTIKRRFGKPWNLQCFYGAHTELTHEIPKALSECQVLQHNIWNEADNENEFEAFCK